MRKFWKGLPPLALLFLWSIVRAGPITMPNGQMGVADVAWSTREYYGPGPNDYLGSRDAKISQFLFGSSGHYGYAGGPDVSWIVTDSFIDLKIDLRADPQPPDPWLIWDAQGGVDFTIDRGAIYQIGQGPIGNLTFAPETVSAGESLSLFKHLTAAPSEQISYEYVVYAYAVPLPASAWMGAGLMLAMGAMRFLSSYRRWTRKDVLSVASLRFRFFRAMLFTLSFGSRKGESRKGDIPTYLDRPRKGISTFSAAQSRHEADTFNRAFVVAEGCGRFILCKSRKMFSLLQVSDSDFFAPCYSP